MSSSSTSAASLAAAHAAYDASLAAAHAAFDAALAAPLAALAHAGFELADADAAREAAEDRGPAISAFNAAREAAEDRFFTARNAARVSAYVSARA